MYDDFEDFSAPDSQLDRAAQVSLILQDFREPGEPLLDALRRLVAEHAELFDVLSDIHYAILNTIDVDQLGRVEEEDEVEEWPEAPHAIKWPEDVEERVEDGNPHAKFTPDDSIIWGS